MLIFVFTSALVCESKTVTKVDSKNTVIQGEDANVNYVKIKEGDQVTAGSTTNAQSNDASTTNTSNTSPSIQSNNTATANTESTNTAPSTQNNDSSTATTKNDVNSSADNQEKKKEKDEIFPGSGAIKGLLPTGSLKENKDDKKEKK